MLTCTEQVEGPYPPPPAKFAVAVPLAFTGIPAGQPMSTAALPDASVRDGSALGFCGLRTPCGNSGAGNAHAISCPATGRPSVVVSVARSRVRGGRKDSSSVVQVRRVACAAAPPPGAAVGVRTGEAAAGAVLVAVTGGTVAVAVTVGIGEEVAPITGAVAGGAVGTLVGGGVVPVAAMGDAGDGVGGVRAAGCALPPQALVAVRIVPSTSAISLVRTACPLVYRLAATAIPTTAIRFYARTPARRLYPPHDRVRRRIAS